jgi:hypothetical protein
MDTQVDVIRNKLISVDKLAQAVQYCLPFDDPGHKIFRRFQHKISWQYQSKTMSVADAMYFFARVIDKSEDELARKDRFIGFLCGERMGHYESLEELYENVRSSTVVEP